MNERDYQTKDTPEQYCDLYEIRKDGMLWHQCYDIVGNDDVDAWKKEHPGETIPLGDLKYHTCMSDERGNKRWVPASFTGELCFYDCIGDKCEGWIEFVANFQDGKLVGEIMLKKHDPVPEKKPA